MKEEEIKIGDSFEVVQNEYGCLSGVVHGFVFNSISLYFYDYYIGNSLTKKIGKLTITKLK